jgi:hypothetical protein
VPHEVGTGGRFACRQGKSGHAVPSRLGVEGL